MNGKRGFPRLFPRLLLSEGFEFCGSTHKFPRSSLKIKHDNAPISRRNLRDMDHAAEELLVIQPSGITDFHRASLPCYDVNRFSAQIRGEPTFFQ